MGFFRKIYYRVKGIRYGFYSVHLNIAFIFPNKKKVQTDSKPSGGML